MKNILFLNFNVGSGIEYTGKSFIKILKENLDDSECQIYEYVHQNPPYLILKALFEFDVKFDLIILNEYYERSARAALYYRMKYPDTRVMLIPHGVSDILEYMKDEFAEHFSRYARNTLDEQNHFLNRYVDKFFLLHDTVQIDDEHIKNKTFFGQFPIDNRIYNSKIAWNERPNKFCYIGTLIPLKFSEEFVQKIESTNIQIDVYGKLHNSNPVHYNELIKNSKNIVLKEYLDQDKVADKFNEYQYFILPHDGPEIFNISLLQSIACGTIPLVVNDRTTDKFNYKWIDWADELYLGTNTVNKLIDIMVKIQDESTNLSSYSEKISTNCYNKFNYDKLSSKFIEIVNNLL